MEWLQTQGCNRSFYTKYIPSKQNPANAPSQGLFPPTKLLLDAIAVPQDIRPFLVDAKPRGGGQESGLEGPSASAGGGHASL